MNRIINSKSYFFGAVATDVVMKFIYSNKSIYYPTILIGIKGPNSEGTEFIWGDLKGKYFTIKIFKDVAILKCSYLIINYSPNGYITNNIAEIIDAISIIQQAWYKK